jgi:hypothetical protein
MASEDIAHDYYDVFKEYVRVNDSDKEDLKKFWGALPQDEQDAIRVLLQDTKLVAKARAELAAPPPPPEVPEAPAVPSTEEPAEPTLGEVDEDPEEDDDVDEILLPYLPTDLEGHSPKEMPYEGYYDLIREITFDLAGLLGANVSEPTVERVAANAASTSYNKWDTVDSHGLRVYIARGLDPQNGEQALRELMNDSDNDYDENVEEERELTEAYKKALGRRISGEAYQAGLFQVLSGMPVDVVVEMVESGRFGDPDETNKLGDVAHDGNGGKPHWSKNK